MKAASLERLQKLICLLANGQFHSGQYLAENIGVSRTAIWKLISKLQTWQIEIFAVRGKGYRIPGGLTLIDSDYLNQKITSKAKLFSVVEVLPTVDSTADHLTRSWKSAPGKGRICVAEHQTKGRGRKGRKWISPFGANLYFSLGLNLPLGLSALGGLSLAVGIGLTKFLNQHSQERVSLKWPNDLLLNNKKLAGILVEASGDSNDSSFLNIGIGINWDMQTSHTDEIDQPWANLRSQLNTDISRSDLLALILLQLDDVLGSYIESGFDSFRKEWSSHSAYFGKSVVLHTHQGKVAGTEIGIDKAGAIKIKTADGEKRFFSGEVSLRSSHNDSSHTESIHDD